MLHTSSFILLYYYKEGVIKIFRHLNLNGSLEHSSTNQPAIDQNEVSNRALAPILNFIFGNDLGIKRSVFFSHTIITMSYSKMSQE